MQAGGPEVGRTERRAEMPHFCDGTTAMFMSGFPGHVEGGRPPRERPQPSNRPAPAGFACECDSRAPRRWHLPHVSG